MTVQQPSPIVTDLELHIEAAFEYFSLKEGGKKGRLPVQSVTNWFKEAGISGMAITGEYTGLSDPDIEAAVAECSKNKDGIEFDEFMECIAIIGQKTQKKGKELLQKLVGCAPLAVVDSGVSYANNST
ncbi:hypothetical protein AVEN_177246-1 [Araneus ventricosus]|uniref:EF-hand domain-containing protein n=1 Tax=Araneus ventricosus TaxID=182803 RepID=A0A4Y2VH84_ARAVE|nr:hypothetical protein AVEN_254496-1 [Araneus ventricosus]GBO23844.1 hypothetical protein AVEN_177246-1 [Araneus ventricosus]